MRVTRSSGCEHCPLFGVVPLAIVIALCCACEPGGPSEPEPAIISVSIAAASGVMPSGPLRLAAVWQARTTTRRSWIATVDVPVDSLNTTQRISVQLPKKSMRASLTEHSEAYVSCNENSDYFVAEVLKPRIVVYEDSDNNGTFEPILPNMLGSDRVWAATPSVYVSPLLVAFEDLDAALSQQPMEIAECVRAQTQGKYTAFFMANDYYSYVTAANVPLRVDLDLSPTDYPSATLACGEYISDSPNDGTVPTYDSRAAVVDSRVTADACADSPFSCTVGDVASKLPSSTASVSYPGYLRSFQCTVSGTLDVLWMTDSRLHCEGCDCSWTESDAAWVVDSTAAPTDWPCGTSLGYCAMPQVAVWNPPVYCGVPTTQRPL